MKIFAVVCVLALLTLVSSAWAEGPKRVKFTWDGGEAVAELNGSAAAESLAAMLPLTLDFEDFNGTERIAYTDEKIDVSGAPASYTPKAGDVTVYAPWGNIAVFYRPFRESRGLVPLGRFVAGADKISALGKSVRLEAVK